jgi:3-polyprenyl-4-hydroxybenzoate decarboxylase
MQAREAGLETHLAATRAAHITRGLGVEPALPFAGAMPLSEGVDESYYLGRLFWRADRSCTSRNSEFAGAGYSVNCY